jgi:predicted MFS family arabinose efflux permease
MASAGTLTILVATGWLGEHVWPILCLSFVSGVAQAFGGPAYQALIPTLVEKEDMPNAIALNSIQFNLAVVVGPALAGLTLARLGEKWCFGLNALSFLAPIISLSLITTRFLPKKTTESMYGSLKEGIRFVRKQASMEALIVLAFCMTALSAPMRTYFPVFVKDIYHRGPQTYGNLLTLMGLGSIGGSLLIAGAGHLGKRGRVALTAIFCLGAAGAGFSFSRSLPQGGAMLVLAGVSMMAAFASVSSLVQLITTDDMRGRVMSVYNVAFRGGMPMGNLLAGALVRGVALRALVVRDVVLLPSVHIPALPVPVVVRLDGALLALVALFFFVIQRRVAKL